LGRSFLAVACVWFVLLMHLICSSIGQWSSVVSAGWLWVPGNH